MAIRIGTLLTTVAVDAAVFAYASFDQLNVIFNIATIAVAIAVAFPIIRSRRKDVTIRELAQACDSKDSLIVALQTDVNGLKTRAQRAEDDCHETKIRAEHWESRYHEQEKYTAQGALEVIGERLAGLEHVLTSAFQSHGELILKNAELLAKLEGRLGKD